MYFYIWRARSGEGEERRARKDREWRESKYICILVKELYICKWYTYELSWLACHLTYYLIHFDPLRILPKQIWIELDFKLFIILNHYNFLDLTQPTQLSPSTIYLSSKFLVSLGFRYELMKTWQNIFKVVDFSAFCVIKVV